MHPLVDLSVPPGHVAVHWFEQASFAVKDAAGPVRLDDAYFPPTAPPAVFIHPTPPLDEAELPVPFVLLTHSHEDHTFPESIQRIWAANPAVVVAGPTEST